MATRKFSDLSGKLSPAARADATRIKNEILDEMALSELRRAREMTQITLAEAMDTTQGEISKIEQRTDMYVSTLRSYVEAMGGELEIVARFGTRDAVKISQFRELATSEK